MDLSEINTKNAEKIAMDLYNLSINIGEKINTIDNMARFQWNSITCNPTEYEFLMENKDDFIRALRIIATNLDRSVIIKCQIDE